MSNEHLNQTPDFKENQAGAMANAWLIDADTALFRRPDKSIEPATLEAISERAKMGDVVILHSTKDENWVRQNLAFPLGQMTTEAETRNRIVMQGKNEESGFEMRLGEEDNIVLNEAENTDWNPARMLNQIESHDIMPATFNIIATNSARLMMENISGLAKPEIRMIHVGVDEDKLIEHENPGLFDKGTRAALMRNIGEKVTPPVESTIELHLNMLVDIKKNRK